MRDFLMHCSTCHSSSCMASQKAEGPVSRPFELRLLRPRHLRPGRRAAAPAGAAYRARRRPARRRRSARGRLGRRRAGIRMIEFGLRSMPARIESTRLVAKKAPARMAVVRVSTLAVPRLDRKPPPPPPPMPSPPPSDFCNRTTPIMVSDDHEVNDDNDSLHGSTRSIMPRREPRLRRRRRHIGSRGRVYTHPRRHFHRGAATADTLWRPMRGRRLQAGGNCQALR